MIFFFQEFFFQEFFFKIYFNKVFYQFFCDNKSFNKSGPVMLKNAEKCAKKKTILALLASEKTILALLASEKKLF